MQKTSFMFKFLCFTTIFLSSHVWARELKSSQYGQVGFDFFGSSLKMPQDYGGNIFAKSAPGMNIYFSKMFHDCFGVEIGYGAIKNRARSAQVDRGSALILGNSIQLAGANFELHRTKIKMFQPYLGLFYNLPMNNHGSVFMQFLGGISLAKLKADISYTANSVGQITPPLDASIKKSKIAPLLKLTLGGNISNNFGLRAFVSWNNLNMKQEEIFFAANRKDRIFKVKNSFNYGLGLFYSL